MTRIQAFAEAQRARRLEDSTLGLAATGWSAGEASWNGRPLLVLGSNDYLGLTQDARVKEAGHEALRRFGAGSTGSRIVTGNTSLHCELEEWLADLVGAERALVFSSGFGTNMGAISALAGESGDAIFYDEESHRSLRDGIQFAVGRGYVFPHNDVGALERRILRSVSAPLQLIVSEGVFSSSGAQAPLSSLRDLATRHDALLYVDDSHGFGIKGGGRGSCNAAGVMPDVFMTSFSKSLGTAGGVVAGEGDVIDFIRWHAGSFAFSAGLPAVGAAVALKSTQIIEEEPDRVRRFWSLTNDAHARLVEAGFPAPPDGSPILAIETSEEVALAMSHDLLERDVWLSPLVHPAVPRGRAVSRVSLIATQEGERVLCAMDALIEVASRRGVLA